MKTIKRYRNGLLIEHIINGVPQKIPLGDRIARIAQPMARKIDKVLKTYLANCGGCKQMQKDLNNGMSITKATKKRFS